MKATFALIKERKWATLLVLIVLVLLGSLFFNFGLGYEYRAVPEIEGTESNPVKSPEVPVGKKFEATHIKTPESVKGIYMTSWLGGVRDTEGNFYARENLIKLIGDTELNAIVIDIKDDTGQIGYEVFDSALKKIGSETKRIPDIREFIQKLHHNNIYVIGRVAVFQDPFLVKLRPDLAIKKATDGSVWHDRKGLTWLDAGAQDVWDYVILIARDAYVSGFDEVQFDYVRFPTDGNLADISYPFFDNTTLTRADQMKQFYEYMGGELGGEIPISADLFGLTTTALDDMGMGQILLNAAPNFDFISPMVYPSHYAAGSYGYNNPNQYPYEIVKKALDDGVAKLTAATTSPLKLRPWLQDFDYGGRYDATAVRAQINATYDAGLTSWLLWDPSVKYEKDALYLE
ncbi:MAG TPA: putative glycoside hydrolase [Candidatus Paceibacterota bacterium]